MLSYIGHLQFPRVNFLRVNFKHFVISVGKILSPSRGLEGPNSSDFSGGYSTTRAAENSMVR